MPIANLQLNHLSHPLGVHTLGPIFSFLSDEAGPFEARLFLDHDLVDQITVNLENSYSFSFLKPLEEGKEYDCEISSKTSKATLHFETAYPLTAPFIKPSSKEIFSPTFYKSFELEAKHIKKARLIITGLGLYSAYLNGKHVGNRYLTPGNNDYDGYLRYQTYDILDLIQNQNELSVRMGDGWYKGRIGIDKPVDAGDKVFGDEYKLCAVILLQWEDGKVEIIDTDESWQYSDSNNIFNNIYDGETLDYSKQTSEKQPAIISKETYNLVPDFGPGIVIKDIVKPTLYISPKGEKILDFGQNLVGFVRMNVKLERGQKVHIQHGEVLQKECFYRDNLRTAKAEMYYIGDGKKASFEPEFTYFGFRYAKIEGLEEVRPEDFEAVVIYTDLTDTLECKTDSSKINQLMHNTYWGQRGNFLDVPTDCPQRDERLGWTADTQVFFNTACYQMDCYNFYKKYIHDLRYDQTMYYNGDLPMYSPSLKHEAGNGGAVWADAGTIIPWNLYLQYGDKGFLEYSYLMIKDYVETLFEKDKAQGDRGLILFGFTFGDWLAQDGVCAQSLAGGTDTGFINSVYYYNSVKIAAKAAGILGRKEDEALYLAKCEKIYQAILDEYFAPNGKLALDTQTSYVLSLHYGIYRDKNRIISDFRERLKKDFYRMKTGFTGTPLILLCLFDNGLDDDAFRILYNEQCPGWLYAINLGATTIWERWNSLLEDGTISGTNMNSLNHYSYGSVCEAIYSRIAGLKRDGIAWKKAIIEPHPNYRMKHIQIRYDSPSGTYGVSWKIEGEQFKLHAEIPFGTKATVILPNGEKYEVGPGEYDYIIDAPNSLLHPFDLDTPNLDILQNEEARKAMQTILPRAYAMVSGENEEFKINTGRFLGYLAMFGTTPESMKAYEEALKSIKAV